MDAILFDFNGVLVDDEHLHLAGFNAVLADFGVTLSPALYEARYIGFDDRGAFEAALRDHGHAAPDDVVRRLIADKARWYLARASTELRIFPGAAALVAACADRGPVGVVSGALRAEIELALGLMGVHDRVRCIVAAEDVTACKPDPAGYLAALDALTAQGISLRPDRVVALEDTPAGVRAARAAGLRVAAVAQSVPEAALREAGAQLTRPTVAALSPEILAALTAQPVA